jgi:hypothetical protein
MAVSAFAASPRMLVALLVFPVTADENDSRFETSELLVLLTLET